MVLSEPLMKVAQEYEHGWEHRRRKAEFWMGQRLLIVDILESSLKEIFVDCRTDHSNQERPHNQNLMWSGMGWIIFVQQILVINWVRISYKSNNKKDKKKNEIQGNFIESR